MPLMLYPQQKSPWCPLDRGLNGPLSQSGHSGEEKNSRPLSELEPPIIDPIAQCYTTELPSQIPFLYKVKISLPLELKSSTSMISFRRCDGDLLMTLNAVLNNVLQCSLWKGTITLTVGSFARYFFSLHLKKEIVISKFCHTQYDSTENVAC
jgi:hypothetical protein